MNNAEYIEVEPEQKTGPVLKKSFSTLLTKKKCVCCKADRRRVARQSDYFRQYQTPFEEIWGHLAADGHRVGLLTGVSHRKNVCVFLMNLPVAIWISGCHRRCRAWFAYSGSDARLNYDLPDDCEDYVHRIGRTGPQAQAVTLSAWRVKSMH